MPCSNQLSYAASKDRPREGARLRRGSWPVNGFGTRAGHGTDEAARQHALASIQHAGLARCRDLGAAAVVVLGHPAYYPRFGFVPAATRSLRCEYEVPDDTFLVRVFDEPAMAAVRGTVRYHEAFREL